MKKMLKFLPIIGFTLVVGLLSFTSNSSQAHCLSCDGSINDGSCEGLMTKTCETAQSNTTCNRYDSGQGSCGGGSEGGPPQQ